MTDSVDVAVVGGGIAGASLAFALADAGLGVVVLEATSSFDDRVRGEAMQPWGVAEARDLGVEGFLLRAGAHVASRAVQYDGCVGEVGEIPISAMVPEVSGTLNLHHPVACQALLDAAAAAGATVVRNASHVQLATAGHTTRTLTFDVGDVTRTVAASLVVGADGRRSTIAAQAGISLQRQAPISFIAGLLLDGLDEIPDHDVLAGEADVFFALFHQGGGRARAYLMTGTSGRHRFAGRNGVQSFLEACSLSCFPWSEHVVSARPAGPVATYPGDDTWTPNPYADKVVLIGDAAGHNDPIIAQGLSVAMRDARSIRDLVLSGARTAGTFASYGAERFARMRRLRYTADVVAVAQAEDADNRDARRAVMLQGLSGGDADMLAVLASIFAGPDALPDEVIDSDLLERIRAGRLYRAE